MTAALPAALTAKLAPGETIVWQDQPRPYVFMLRGLTSIFYGLTWSILGAYWYHGAMLADFQGWWHLVPLLSLPFVFAGWSFFFYPIHLGARARHTWYVVTDQRVFIARLPRKQPVQLRVFTTKEMAPPHVVHRFDGLDEVILTRRAQDKPYLMPTLESGFFGITQGEAAAKAVKTTLHL